MHMEDSADKRKAGERVSRHQELSPLLLLGQCCQLKIGGSLVEQHSPGITAEKKVGFLKTREILLFIVFI